MKNQFFLVTEIPTTISTEIRQNYFQLLEVTLDFGSNWLQVTDIRQKLIDTSIFNNVRFYFDLRSLWHIFLYVQIQSFNSMDWQITLPQAKIDWKSSINTC